MGMWPENLQCTDEQRRLRQAFDNAVFPINAFARSLPDEQSDEAVILRALLDAAYHRFDELIHEKE